MQAQQQRHIRKGDARYADRDDAACPDLDIGRSLGADAKQTERSRKCPHDTDQSARQRVGIHDRKDHKPGSCEIADLGTQQHRGDTDEDEHREQLERETSQHERQSDQRLPGARQTETPLKQPGLRGYIRRGGWRVDHGQRRRRGTRRLRKARFQPHHRPLDDTGDQPFGSEGATEHQPQFPRDIEQLIISGRIIGRLHDPVVERGKARQRPRHIGDLVRDLADLLGYR